jgi:hypothetical protein
LCRAAAKARTVEFIHLTINSMKYFRHRPFELGRIVVSAELTAVLDLTVITEALLRHSRGDWGEVSHDGCEANENALIRGGRVWSSHRSNDIEFRIVTEADRLTTNVFTVPEE